VSRAHSRPTVVLDGRWLHIGGPGRTTELLLRGLSQEPPRERWVLWGPPSLEQFVWPGAEVVPIAVDPRRLLGQRNALDVPPGELTVFMHQQRPLRNVRAVTTIYDTIALRYGTNRPVRAVKRRFLQRVAASSARIMTISAHSKASIMRDLGIPASTIDVLRFPFDEAFVDRVLRLRTSVTRSNTALFVGGFLPHKNLPRLLEAFGRTEFCRQGGRLLLAGGTRSQVAELQLRLTAIQREFVSVQPACGQAELDALFASSLLLIQPSLEEGFGLPAWEALCCGLPVCVSDGGALPEVVAGFVDSFPATSVPAMADAIDGCASGALGKSRAPEKFADELRRTAPTIGDFASQVYGIIEAELAGAGRR
jgi:glycosyltransferase involved in cell wall biosynthesis